MPDEKAPEEYGCGDHGCIFRFMNPAGGMRTNGGCRCLIPELQGARRIRVRRAIFALRAEVERLKGLLKDANGVLDIAAAGGLFLNPKMASLEAIAAKVKRAAPRGTTQ